MAYITGVACRVFLLVGVTGQARLSIDLPTMWLVAGCTDRVRLYLMDSGILQLCRMAASAILRA